MSKHDWFIHPSRVTSVPPSAPNQASAHQHSLLLDNWRGWAILCVLLGHFIHMPAANFGRLGVELFFVLSGRLMADLLFVKRTELTRFFYRRFTRVFPVSLLFVITALVIFPPGANQLSPGAALAALGMVINYTQLVGIDSSVTEHFWSLCVEEHSYLALGLVAFVLRRSGHASGRTPAVVCLVLAALMIANGWRLWLAEPDYYRVYWRSDTRAATIFLSVGMRLLFVQGVPAALRAAWIPVAAGLLGLALSTNHVPDPAKYSAGAILLALCINSLEQSWAFVRRLLGSRTIAWFGLVSYSIYIFQQPFYNSVEAYGGLPMLLGAVGVGAAISLTYEQPLRLWLNHHRNRPAFALAARQP